MPEPRKLLDQVRAAYSQRGSDSDQSDDRENSTDGSPALHEERHRSGSGLRLAHALALLRSAGACVGCLRLREKDIDFGNHQIIVRDGKGEKDRATIPAPAVGRWSNRAGTARS